MCNPSFYGLLKRVVLSLQIDLWSQCTDWRWWTVNASLLPLQNARLVVASRLKSRCGPNEIVRMMILWFTLVGINPGNWNREEIPDSELASSLIDSLHLSTRNFWRRSLSLRSITGSLSYKVNSKRRGCFLWWDFDFTSTTSRSSRQTFRISLISFRSPSKSSMRYTRLLACIVTLMPGLGPLGSLKSSSCSFSYVQISGYPT